MNKKNIIFLYFFTWYQSHGRFGLEFCHVFNFDNTSSGWISFRSLHLRDRKHQNSSLPSDHINADILFQRQPLPARYPHQLTCRHHRRQELRQLSSHALSRACLSLVAIPQVSARGWHVSDPPAIGFSHLDRLPSTEFYSSLVLPSKAFIFLFCLFLSPIVLFSGLFLSVLAFFNSPTPSTGFSHLQQLLYSCFLTDFVDFITMANKAPNFSLFLSGTPMIIVN